jgi:hypothetical protein
MVGDGLSQQQDDGVGGQAVHRLVKAERATSVLGLRRRHAGPRERLHSGAPVGVVRGELGIERLEQHLGLQQLLVRGGTEVEVHRGAPRQMGRVDGAHDGAAARSGLDLDEALHLEQAQRFPQRARLTP